MSNSSRDLWPPSVGHRVAVREGGRTGKVRDIVMDAGEAKYRVDLDFVAGKREYQRDKEGLFTLGQLDPYFPP